jgi:sporulation protein YlmC with PRC-barrel domain
MKTKTLMINMVVINLTALNGKDVYTRNAKFVGKVDDSMLDTEKGNVYGFVVNMARDSFLYKMLPSTEQGVKKTILIPYREILSCDDIVLVTVPKQYEKVESESAISDEEADVILPGISEVE